MLSPPSLEQGPLPPLILSGKLAEAKVEYDDGGMSVSIHHRSLEKEARMSNDYTIRHISPDYIPSGKKVFCLKLLTQFKKADMAGEIISLVLRKVGPKEDTYERIRLLE